MKRKLDIYTALLFMFRLQDIRQHDMFLRMTIDDFEYLLEIVKPTVLFM